MQKRMFLFKESYLSSDFDRNGGVMVSMLASSVVGRGFETRSGQTKDYKIAICCFLAKHTALRRKRKDWLGRNQIMIRVTYLSVDSFAVS